MATTSESLAFDRGVRPMLEIVLPESVTWLRSVPHDSSPTLIAAQQRQA